MSFQLVPLALALLFAATDGGDACTGPQYRKLKPPKYPAAAVAARIEGSSLVRATIDRQGTVTSTLLEKSSGNADLDAAALEVVGEWTFEPRRCNGQVEVSYAIVPVRFSLVDDDGTPPTDKVDEPNTAGRAKPAPHYSTQRTFAADDQAMEFKTISGQLAYFRSSKDIKEDQRSNLSFYSDFKNLKFWTAYRTPLGSYGAISRIRMEMTADGYREFFSMICEAPADWCQDTRASDFQFHQENPMPPPPPPPVKSPAK